MVYVHLPDGLPVCEQRKVPGISQMIYGIHDAKA